MFMLMLMSQVWTSLNANISLLYKGLRDWKSLICGFDHYSWCLSQFWAIFLPVFSPMPPLTRVERYVEKCQIIVTCTPFNWSALNLRKTSHNLQSAFSRLTGKITARVQAPRTRNVCLPPPPSTYKPPFRKSWIWPWNMNNAKLARHEGNMPKYTFTHVCTSHIRCVLFSATTSVVSTTSDFFEAIKFTLIPCPHVHTNFCLVFNFHICNHGDPPLTILEIDWLV